jgi:hypothetical protein
VTPENAAEIVQRSLVLLFQNDSLLLTNDVSERAITHRLAQYIESALTSVQLNGLQVDCEYNRNLPAGPGAPKRIELLVRGRAGELQNRNDLDEDEYRSVTTFPDIVVHHRGDNARNALVIEVKKSTNKTSEQFDHQKLCAFTENTEHNAFRYCHGVFIYLIAGEPELTPARLEWFRNGERALG